MQSVKEHIHLPQKPSVGRIVHCHLPHNPEVAHAAIITNEHEAEEGKPNPFTVDLAVVFPSGLSGSYGVPFKGHETVVQAFWVWPPRA